VVSSLRRSATRVLEATSCGAISTTIRAGTTQLSREPLAKKKDFPHTPQPGDLLLIADASGVELATVANAGGLTITLTQPLIRAMRPATAPWENVARVRYYSVALNDPATHQTALRPLRLAEVAGAFPGGSLTQLALDKSYEGLAPGTVVALASRSSAARNSVRGISTAPRRARWVVGTWQSMSSVRLCAKNDIAVANATVEASVMRANLESPKNTRPSAMP